MRRLAPVIAVGVLLLAACAPIPLPGSDWIGERIEQETGGQVDLGTGARVPGDWPAELPLPTGELESAVSIDGAHSLTYRIAGPGVGEQLVADLVARGFAERGRADLGALVTTDLDLDGWTVVVGWVIAEDRVTLTYTSTSR